MAEAARSCASPLSGEESERERRTDARFGTGLDVFPCIMGSEQPVSAFFLFFLNQKI